MSRFIFVPVALCFALAPVRAADPKPLWEIETAFVKTAFHEVEWLDMTPDGKTLVTRTRGTKIGEAAVRVVVWDVQTRKEKSHTTLRGAYSPAPGLQASAITKEGTVLLADNELKDLRLAEGKLFSLPTPTRSSAGQAVWCNGTTAVWLTADPFDIGLPYRFTLAFGSLPSLVSDPKTPEADKKLRLGSLKPVPDDYEIRAVDVSPDLTRIAVAAYVSKIDKTGKLDLKHTLTLYTIAANDKLELTEVASVPGAHRGYITRMRFSPDGKTLATASGESSVALWDVSKAGKGWEPRVILPAGLYTASALAFAPDGRALAAGTYDERGRPNLYLIDATAGKLLASYRLDGAITALAYSSDGKTLLTGDSRGRVKAWDADALKNP